MWEAASRRAEGFHLTFEDILTRVVMARDIAETRRLQKVHGRSREKPMCELRQWA